MGKPLEIDNERIKADGRLSNVAHCVFCLCLYMLLLKQGKTFLRLSVTEKSCWQIDGEVTIYTGSFSVWPLMSQAKQTTTKERRNDNGIYYHHSFIFHSPSFHLDIPPWTHPSSLMNWQRRKARALFIKSSRFQFRIRETLPEEETTELAHQYSPSKRFYDKLTPVIYWPNKW